LLTKVLKMIVSENILQNTASSLLEELLSELKKDTKSFSDGYYCAILNLSLFELLKEDKYFDPFNRQYQNLISYLSINKNPSNITLLQAAFLGQILVKKGINHNLQTLIEIDSKLFENVKYQIKFSNIVLNNDFNYSLNYFSQNPENKLHVFFVEELVKQLVQVIKKDKLGSRIVQTGNVDFTFPSGMPGLLITLIKVYLRILKDAEIKSIIDDGIKYILNYKNDVDFSENSFDFFPNYILEDEEKPIFSNQISLSSGDLGKAILLYQYSKISDNANILKLANFVGLNTLIRKSQYQHNVADASLLNGSSGIALMYHKMYQFSNLEAYKQGKEFWINKTIDFLNQENSFEPPQKFDIWEGKLGVNLALLSCLTNKKMSWEKMYGLSI
jgi:lantibiotic biosynthesis protein